MRGDGLGACDPDVVPGNGKDHAGRCSARSETVSHLGVGVKVWTWMRPGVGKPLEATAPLAKHFTGKKGRGCSSDEHCSLIGAFSLELNRKLQLVLHPPSVACVAIGRGRGTCEHNVGL